MRALVTGGAGLIGSHLADLLLAEGWDVRVYDSLEPRTHRDGKPAWLAPRADFVRADVRDPEAMSRALEGIDVVFHQAAYGGFFPDLGQLCDVNVTGTARLLETIRDRRLPVKKVVIASSQVVYREGTARCMEHGAVFPFERSLQQLRAADWRVRCPHCDRPAVPAVTTIDAPAVGETPYAISKMAQERLALVWGKQTGTPVVALRYGCTYGPRQSIFNPYTGIIAIFSTRLLNGKPAVLYEDGEQTRDLCFVADVARANLIVAMSPALDGRAVNVGSGRGVSVRTVAQTVADVLGSNLVPELSGAFRPGDLRDLIGDIAPLRALGFEARIGLHEGIARYVSWIRTQGDVREYFGAAQRRLREAGLVQQSNATVLSRA